MVDFSYGIIPFCVVDWVVQVLLIQHVYGNHWSFPKWHKNIGESDLDAARREFEEETGVVEYSVLENISFESVYKYKKSEDLINKTVKYFLAEVIDISIHLQEDEILDAVWLELNDVFDKITFDSDQQMFIKVLEYYKK